MSTNQTPTRAPASDKGANRWRRLPGAARAAGLGRDAASVILGTARTVRLVWEAHAGYAAAVVALNVIQGLLPLAQAWLTKLIVDAIVVAVRGDLSDAAIRSPLRGSPGLWSSVWELIILFGMVTLASQALQPATQLVQAQLGDYLTRTVNVRILRKANSLVDLSFFESPTFYDFLQRAQHEAGYRPMSML